MDLDFWDFLEGKNNHNGINMSDLQILGHYGEGECSHPIAK